MQWIKCENGSYLNTDNILSITFMELPDGNWRVVAMLPLLKKNYPIQTVETKEEAQTIVEALVATMQDGITKQ
jgi:hypothetical protein